jgi:F-type H+-transporting ATPase subunit b
VGLIEQLGLNGTLLAAIVQFLLLLILLRAVAYKPILKAMEDRQNNIEQSIREAENSRAEAKRVIDEYTAKMQEARQEASGIIENATKLAEASKAEILAKAQEETVKLTAKAKADIQAEKEKALAQLRDEVANLAILAASKIINKEINNQDHIKMVKEFVAEVGDLPC